jgi:hypothetical protein
VTVETKTEANDANLFHVSIDGLDFEGLTFNHVRIVGSNTGHE